MIRGNNIRKFPLLHFVELGVFLRSREDLLSDDDLAKVEDELQENPYAGDLVPGTGGVRKLRAAGSGRGKRGGARVLYYYAPSSFTVYFFLAYAKNQSKDLSTAGKQMLQRLVENIQVEEE